MAIYWFFFSEHPARERTIKSRTHFFHFPLIVFVYFDELISIEHQIRASVEVAVTARTSAVFTKPLINALGMEEV